MVEESRLIISIDARNAERNARELNRELNNMTTNGIRAESQMNGMGSAFRSLAGYMAGVVTIGTAISKMDTYTGLQNRLKLVTDSQNELNQAMSDTFAIAQKTASSWDSAAMVYQRFADNADRLNITMKQTASLTETVSKAISISGGTAASADAALVQFGQALASGVLRGEEFNSIAEQAPGLLKAIANGLDTNVGSLRAMAAEGKITADVLVKSLTKAQPYIDDLFNKTDFTIAQSFTRLSNEVTKFIGVAGTGSGAAAGLSSAISALSNNLSTIADIAIIGGVALLTKTILTQTVAIYGSITASIARRAASLAEFESQAQLAGIEVQRTRQVVALAATEVNLSRIEYNNAVTRAERAAATMRLTQAEIALALAEKQKTASTIADTAAQNANNAARSRGAMLLGAVGGPIGAITIGVAALAAGYMYLKARTAEATAKLEEQGKVALETDENLKQLAGNDKISAVKNLTAAFNDQNDKLAKSKESVDAVLFAIRASSVENEKARKITEDARNGVISYNEAIQLLNKEKISTDLYDKLKEQANQYDENSLKAGNSQRVLKILGVEFKLAGNAAQNAANQIDKNSDSMGKNETAAQKAARAQKEYAASLFDKDFEANFTKYTLAAGLSEGKTNALLEAANYARKKGVEFTKEMAQEALRVYEIENKNKEVIDARNEAEKKKTKEKEKQYKYSQDELKMLQKVAELSAKNNLDEIGAKYGIPKNYLAGLMAQESKGNPNAVSPTGAVGYFQTTERYRKDNGISVADSKNLPVIAEVVAKNLAKAYKELGSWEAAIRSHNAGVAGSANFAKTGMVKGSSARNKEVANFAPNVNKWIVGLGGSSLKNKGTADAINDLKEYYDFIKGQEQSRKSLELEVANEVTKIRENLKDKLIELDKAGFSPERTKELKAEYTARAENEIAIAEYALKTKLEDYKSFEKSESQLLKASFDEKKFYAARDIELSKEQRVQAVELLDKQYKQEKAYLELGRQQRIFQAEQEHLGDIERINQKYRLERAEILKTVNEEERRRKLVASIESQKKEEQGIIVSAQQNYDTARGVDDSAALEMKTRQDAIDQAYAVGLIKQAEYQEASKLSKQQYDNAMLSMNIGYGEQIAGSMASMFGAMMGEQSTAFKIMFAAEKAFAIARSVIAIQTGIAQASALPFPANLGAMATVAAQTASIVANIKSVIDTGFKDGGYTGNYGTSQVAGVVHGKEFVVNAEGTRRNRAALEAMNSGATLSGGGGMVQPIINVYTLEGETADVTTNADGSLDIRIRKVAGDYLRNELSSQNSQTSKAIKQNFNVTAKR